MYPSPLPDLFKGEQLVLVGRYSGSGGSAAVIEGTVNGEQKKFTYDVKFPAESGGNDFIPRLWATRRVGFLLDEIRLHGENTELRDEVTDLARKYGIVTPFTAYLIVEDESRRGLAVNAQSLPQFQSDAAAQQAAAMHFRLLEEERDGTKAVLAARSGASLKMATAAAPAIQTGAGEAGGAFGLSDFTAGPSGNPAPAARVMEYSRQTRFAGGRNFFGSRNQWIEAGVQKASDAKRVRIEFGSPEYFTLLKQHPETASWLALGSQVQFVLRGAVYEIFEVGDPQSN
jgi:Ca-activated chloride channel family protein